MPLKVDQPQPDIPVHERDILRIKANINDELMVEDEKTQIEELEEKVIHFYTANIGIETDKTMPEYETITTEICVTEIANLQQKNQEVPDNLLVQDELKKWETKLEICNDLGGAYNEFAPMAIIRLEYASSTSYGLYIQIQNTLKKVVNDLRQEKCRTYFNRDYYDLDPTVPADIEIIEKIRILVPERIIDAPIER